MAPFVPAKSFNGARHGYVFKKDYAGLGYYLDDGVCRRPADSGHTDVERHRRDASCFGYLSGLFNENFGRASVAISLEHLLAEDPCHCDLRSNGRAPRVKPRRDHRHRGRKAS
eukprot:5769468-Karenia_brevis.AAC.1